MAMEEFEGIVPAHAASLEAAGITSGATLLAAAGTRAGRAKLVEQTGIGATLILDWVNHADLYRIKGIGSEYADLLEEAVWNDVCALLREPSRVEQEYQRRLSGETATKEHQGKEQVASLLQKVKRGIARLIDAYSDGLVDKSEFEPRIRRAKERLAALEAQAKTQADLEVRERELRLVIGRLQEFGERVKQGLDGADWSTRREIIRTLVKRIEIGEGDVADHAVQAVVEQARVAKVFDADVLIRVERTGDAAGDAIQLDADEAHTFWSQGHEVADATARFEN
jgi:hypothetical protein